MGQATELKLATFGAGCFWHIEEAFSHLDGVTATAVGFMGGSVPDPSYELVCTAETGHAEVVQLQYDPACISYDELLEVFWQIHDPTTLNRQGPDFGTQYRSVIFCHDAEQRAAAQAFKDRLQKAGTFGAPIVTQIVPAGPFYRAEEYHQKYFERNGLGQFCGVAEPPMAAGKKASSRRD